MNPLTKVKLINELNEREASLGVKDSVSWHSEYKDSAWIFIGGFPYELTEGDIICVFSQYGEIVNINLVRDKKTGKSKGFCFLCYEDQRSTILSVDNLNGIKIKGRTIRVDHVSNYRPPKDSEDIDDVTKSLRVQGCAPKLPSSSSESEEDDGYVLPLKKAKKDKKEKKKKKKEKKEKKKEKKEEAAAGRSQDGRVDQRQSSPSPPSAQVKKEKVDEGYDKYARKGPSDTRLPREERQDLGRERERERQEDGSSRDWHPSDRDRDRDRDRERIKEEDRRKDWSRDGRDGRATSPRDKNRQRVEREDKPAHRDSHPRDGWDRPREKDRERERDREKERERERDRDKDRERERERERDRDRDREREKDRDRERDRDREKDRDRERDRDRGRDKERERDRDRKYR